jgi:hypothetical protein
MEQFGFIHNKLEVKILILFILNRLPEPVTKEALAELTLCDNGITYFDFTDALGELVASGHICETDGRYIITDKGSRNVLEVEASVPYSVRLKAERNTQKLSRELMRNTMIKTSHEERSTGGVTVSLSLSDGIDNIAKMELLAGNEKQAQIIEKNFKKNAEHIYNALINILLSETL